MPPDATSNRPSRKKIALVSIHDVMPANLDRILGIISFLRGKGVRSITLLIVPGKDWRPRDIEQLQKLQEDTDIGFAGHGWHHGIDGFGSLWHRLHGLLISRKEAEHLSLAADKIAGLILKNHEWFAAVGLKPPELYVPPAWAMGKISRKKLDTLPFRYYETLVGVYDAKRGCTRPMAVCGYMADTRARSLALRATNAVNRFALPFPLRIAIHPEDLDLLLAPDLADCLEKDYHFSSYQAFFGQ